MFLEDTLDENIENIVISINAGITFVSWFIYLSLILSNFSILKQKNLRYLYYNQRHFLTNFLTNSLIFLFLFNYIFENVYGYTTFRLLKDLSLTAFIFVSPLIVRITTNRHDTISKSYLTIYGIVTFITSIFLILGSLYDIPSVKLLIITIPISVSVIESVNFFGIYNKELNNIKKISIFITILLPSLLAISVANELTKEENKNIINTIISLSVITLFNLTTIINMIRTTIEKYKNYKTLLEELSKEYKNEETIFRWFTVMLISILEERDYYTKGHSERVAKYSYNLAKIIYKNTHMPNFIELGALLHDIGKLGVRDEVLLHPSKLPPDMMEEMKTHTVIGKELLSSVSLFRDLSDIAYLHHEKVNGEGYPLRLNGKLIPDYVKITTIADVFDALNSSRVYREKLDIESIKQLFRENLGQHFDEKIGTIFLKNLSKIV
ncbi:MAG: HD domain-containing protein [Brevinematales bacterium]|nr:HD domain-containing protein [Brevinematales bacterium]